jgi:two-component system NarL family response regulator
MPGASGLWVLERLREQHPHVAAIVFSGCDEREQIDLALRLGARGYVLKTLAIANLPAIVRANLAGHLYFAPDGWAEHAQQETIRETGLTEKELDVLAAVAEGLSNREIATRLWLSAETVKTHLSSVYRKLDVNSRVAAARVAYELHLLDPPTQTLAAAQ